MAVDKDDVVQVKEAFKWVMQDLVAKELGGVAVVNKVGEDGDGRFLGFHRLNFDGMLTDFVFPELVRGRRGVHPPGHRQRLPLPVSLPEH